MASEHKTIKLQENIYKWLKVMVCTPLCAITVFHAITNFLLSYSSSEFSPDHFVDDAGV